MSPESRNYSSYITETGLDIPAGTQFTAEDIGNLIEVGDTMSSSGRWLRADVTALAQDTYGDEWYQYLPFTVSRATLTNEAGIARKFPRNRRHKQLKFRYYERVRGLEPDDADRWLQKAIKDELKPDELRQMINDVSGDNEQERITTCLITHIADVLKENGFDGNNPVEVTVKGKKIKVKVLEAIAA